MNPTMALSGEKFVISEIQGFRQQRGAAGGGGGVDLIKSRQKQRDKDHFIHFLPSIFIKEGHCVALVG